MLITLSLICAMWAVCDAAIPTWSSTGCGKSKYSDAGEMELPTGFIVGGEQTRPFEFPWQVSLRNKTRNNSQFCGGSIIAKDWIVTAAHCIVLPPESIAIGVGDWNISAPSGSFRLHDVSLIKVHENYRNLILSPVNDIALIKLSTPITFNDNVQPACAPDSSVDYTYRKVLTSGWGDLGSGLRQYPDTLRYVTLNVTTDTYCKDQYKKFRGLFTITDEMICSSDNLGSTQRDSCQGDSGGPLVLKEADGTFRLVGVVSYGYGCASNVPGVYARVTVYNDWITDFINNN